MFCCFINTKKYYLNERKNYHSNCWRITRIFLFIKAISDSSRRMLSSRNYQIYIPVVCNNQGDIMPETKIGGQSNSRNKVLKIDVDPHTGDKYINLNGRKIKISPVQPSVTTNKEIINSQKTPAGTQPLKLKIIKIQHPNSHNSFINVKKTNVVDLASISEQINKNCLSETLITSCELQNGKSSGSSNVTLKPDTIGKTQQTNMSETATENSVIQSKKVDENKQDGALDLSNHSLESNNILDSKSTSNKSCQTDDVWYGVPKDNIVDIGVQTEDSLEAPLGSFESFDIDTLLKDNLFLSNNTYLPSKEILDPLCTPLDSLIELPLQNHQQIPTVREATDTANKFFNELRSALSPDDKGNMPIHIGVLCNNLKTVQKCGFILKILQQSIDLPNNSDLTPLQLAIIYDVSCEIIDYLLAKGASLDTIDDEGNNIVHLAVEYKRVDILHSILKHAREQQFDLDQSNHEGLTPLMIACINKQYDCAKFLLEFEADVNARDLISGRTSLFHAAENHDVAMVQLLLNYEAKTKLKNFFGTSPHDAMYEIEDMPEQIKMLILLKNNKRKNAEEALPPSTKVRKKGESGLKTYSVYKKIVRPQAGRKMRA